MSMRKWLKFIISSVFSAVLVFISGCGVDDYISDYFEKSDEIVLRLANNHAPDFPTSKACDYFAQLVEEKTGGKIKIICFHDAELGDESSTLKQVQLGGIDFARVSVSLLAQYDESLNVLSLPYLYENSEHMKKVLESETGEEFLKSSGLMENGFEGICWYTAGSRNFYSVSPLDDGINSLKGLRIRTQQSELLEDTVSALGAKPVPMKFEDVYPAFMMGNIDAAENNIPSYISTQHYKTARYMMLDEHSMIPEMIVVSKTTMENLNHEYQNIIRECAKQSTQKQFELWNDYEKQCLQTAIDAGCQIVSLTPEQKAAFKEAVKDVKAEYSAGYEDLTEKIENMAADYGSD